MIFGEIEVEDEYNPLIPNDYEQLMVAREEARRRQREEDRKRDLEERDKYALSTDSPTVLMKADVYDRKIYRWNSL